MSYIEDSCGNEYEPGEINSSEVAYMAIKTDYITIGKTRFSVNLFHKEGFWIYCEYEDGRPSWSWYTYSWTELATRLEREIEKEIQWQEMI